MTALDRILEKFPGTREILSWLDNNLLFVFGVPLVLIILFVFYWACFLAPRKATRILRSLQGKGYSQVPPNDLRLGNALERLTPIMHHTYELSTVTKTSPWRVEVAYGNNAGWTSRFFAHINRSVSRSPRDGSIKLEHEFTIAFLEIRNLPFKEEVHIAGDRYSLDLEYGLHAVDNETLGVLSSLFVFYTRDGKLEPLPPALEEALMQGAPFLSVWAERRNRSDPFLFHARIRFTPEGWGLISSEFVYRQEKMDALLRVVDRISRSLS